MVFQHFNLFPHLTVLENITLGPRKLRKMPTAEANALAEKLLRQVGLSDKRDAYPSQLSGGSEAAHRDCTHTCNVAGCHSFQRADFGARS